MEFGTLPYDEINNVDFSLPPEPGRNATVLTGQRNHPKLYVGMPQWGRTEWVGKLYPKGAKQRDFVTYYAKQFNAIEFNATHYRLWEPWKLAQWAGQANSPAFMFCPKMFKEITHRPAIDKKQELLKQFLGNIEGFGKNLGPVFIQLQEGFNGKRKKELFDFLEQLPVHSKQFFLELRHPELLSNEALFDYLQSKNIGVVITDAAGRRDCAHMKLTIPKVFIRCIFNNHSSDIARIIDWASRLNRWMEQGLTEVYFFVHAKDERATPAIAQGVIATFNKVCKVEIPELQFIPGLL